MTKKQNQSLSISTRSFLTAIAVILVLMIATYVLTLFVPSGSFDRITDENGNTVIDTSGEFTYTEGGISFGKWLLSPVLVLGASGNGALIAVIAFLIVIGGIFHALDRCGLIRFMLFCISKKFAASRYRLMAVTAFFFMALGAMIGSFEEVVPLVPIVVALAVSLGFDALTGIGMSMLAVGCGFATGVCNPFTVGVAQKLAGLPMFSGIGLRLLAFVCIYLLLIGFLTWHAKRIARPVTAVTDEEMPTLSPKLKLPLICFAVILGIGILTVLASALIPALQDYTIIIVAVAFLAAGLTATAMAGMPPSVIGKEFLRGVISILPAVLMILMASSIKYTLEEASVLDTLLHYAIGLASDLPREAVVLLIYGIVLVMNFFIPSGSAKAFMLIPLIVPIASIFDISAQLCVLAFAFGDGFSNVAYPTNPALLISLGLADTSYTDWFRYSAKFQVCNLVLTSLILLLGLAIGY